MGSATLFSPHRGLCSSGSGFRGKRQVHLFSHLARDRVRLGGQGEVVPAFRKHCLPWYPSIERGINPVNLTQPVAAGREIRGMDGEPLSLERDKVLVGNPKATDLLSWPLIKGEMNRVSQAYTVVVSVAEASMGQGGRTLPCQGDGLFVAVKLL